MPYMDPMGGKRKQGVFCLRICKAFCSKCEHENRMNEQKT